MHKSNEYNILGLKCDVSKYSDIKSLVDISIKRFRGMDILVNNVGIVYYGRLIDTTEEEWDRYD